MHKLSAVLMVLFALGLIAHAQETPKVEVFTGYSFVSAGFPFSTDPAAGNGNGVLNGWNFSAAVNANRWVGVVADFGGYYGPVTKGTTLKRANCVLCTSNFDGILHNIHTFTAGPQLSIRQDRVTVFAHALFGGAHIWEDLIINILLQRPASPAPISLFWWVVAWT
jgi:hypothetical protein